ncbi:MAG TPA: hemerythrin domain-containing protein [Polyangiaceae bacterium]|nr:hemerythrin domain-containing protein [Polyangiaceae bacterium]
MPNAVERAASELAGVAKDVKAGFKGLTGVFMHLMEEHGKVGALVKRVSLTSDIEVRSKLYPTIRSELKSHEQGELKAVYPELSAYPETAAIAAAHAHHASELEAAIAELDALSFNSAGWTSAFERLAKLVEEHVAIEEKEYFPLAQKVLGEERAKEMLPAFEAAKKLG